MTVQSPGTSTWDSFGTPTWESQKKKNHFDVASAESYRVYYMGEGGGFPRVWAVVSLVCKNARGLSPTPKGVPKCELTLLWLVLDADSCLIF